MNETVPSMSRKGFVVCSCVIKTYWDHIRVIHRGGAGEKFLAVPDAIDQSNFNVVCKRSPLPPSPLSLPLSLSLFHSRRPVDRAAAFSRSIAKLSKLSNRGQRVYNTKVTNSGGEDRDRESSGANANTYGHEPRYEYRCKFLKRIIFHVRVVTSWPHFSD